MTDTESYWDKRDPVDYTLVPTAEETKEEWLRNYFRQIKHKKDEESKGEE